MLLHATPLVGSDSLDFFRFSGELQSRFEALSGQYRALPRLDHADQLGVSRLALQVELQSERVAGLVEFVDNRQYGASSGSALDTGIVNTLDVLQAAVELKLGELGSGTHRLRIGRQTFDLGSRRLAARNRFRSTINNFTGIDWLWQEENAETRIFWQLPVRRLPFGPIDDLVDNVQDWDEQSFDTQFLGVFHSRQPRPALVLESYLLGLLEDERLSERRLLTPGIRLLRPESRADWDFESENVVQLGETRPGGSGKKLDHFAFYHRSTVGYTFDRDCRPRLALAFDYASGDRDPTDGDSGTFDTLYGVRREFGPTSLYGPLIHSNMISPELRLTARPTERVQTMIAYRGYWLASRKAPWRTAGVSDPTGSSGRHVGQQLEAQLRYDVVPRRLKLELGAAQMFRGGFQRDAPGGQNTDTSFGYVQLQWLF